MKRILALSILLGLLPSLKEARAQTPPSFLPSNYGLVYNDNFSGTSLDSNWSNTTIGGEESGAAETSRAISVDNGLTISSYTRNGTNYTAGLSTQSSGLTFTYGYFQATMEFLGGSTGGAGIFSDFWLESTGMLNSTGSSLPLSSGAEIDVVEHRYTPTTSYPGNTDWDVHWNGYGSGAESDYDPFENAALDSGYHTYGVLWTPTGYTFYIDGTDVGQTSSGVSTGPEFLVLTSQIDDSYWAGNAPTAGYGALGSGNPETLVSDVEVFQIEAAPEPSTAELILLGLSAVAFVAARKEGATRSKN
jgi:hypothetical protein